MHRDFTLALARLASDDNAQVRKAAQSAAARRRDWAGASAFSKQHEDYVNVTLDEIEVRFGVRGRDAVKRASERIADAAARELYHEAVKLLSPLAGAAERLATRLVDETVSRTDLATEAFRIKERVTRLQLMLKGMREYAAQAALRFTLEDVRELVDESVSGLRDSGRTTPAITIAGGVGVRAEVSRIRLIQALTNLLTNAVEAYTDERPAVPIEVRISTTDHQVVVAVEDFGCGMNDEVLKDAVALFVTTKSDGTGVGLPLAIRIVEAEHDGRLHLASRKGSGTTVTLTIPAKRQRDRT